MKQLINLLVEKRYLNYNKKYDIINIEDKKEVDYF